MEKTTTAATSDSELIEEYLAGDADAIAPLYRRYFHRLTRACERVLHSHAEAEDVAQEALVRALDHLESYDRRRPVWPWLHAIGVRLALNELERKKRTCPQAATQLEPIDPDHAQEVADRRTLAFAFRRLAPRQRQALFATYVEGRSRREVADKMGLREPALDQLLLRGRRRLAETLGS